MSLDKLDQLFQPFLDPLEKFYKLSVNKLFDEGLKIDLTPFLHWNSFSGSVGGINQNGFILINPKNSGSQIYFSFNPNSLPSFFKVPVHWFEDRYIQNVLNVKNFSLKLQQRLCYQKIILFPDESYTFKLFVGDEEITGRWNGYYLESEHPLFLSDYNAFNLISRIKEKGISLCIQGSGRGLLRKEYEETCLFNKTLDECFYIFSRLIKDPHHYRTHFSYFNATLNNFNILPLSTSEEEFFYKLNQLSKNNFHHLDFFSWSELFMSFNLIKDHREFNKENKLLLKNNIKNLENSLPIIPMISRF